MELLQDMIIEVLGLLVVHLLYLEYFLPAVPSGGTNSRFGWHLESATLVTSGSQAEGSGLSSGRCTVSRESKWRTIFSYRNMAWGKNRPHQGSAGSSLNLRCTARQMAPNPCQPSTLTRTTAILGSLPTVYTGRLLPPWLWPLWGPIWKDNPGDKHSWTSLRCPASPPRFPG